MSVATLTFTASEEQITSGIPEYLTIESNIPATIYYTIDGTVPDAYSLIYTDAIAIPTNMTSVIVSAFGIDSLDVSGPILTQTFSADQSDITRTRNVGNEGIVLDEVGFGQDYVVGYDANGNPATFLDFEPELINAETIHSEKGFDGEAPGTKVSIGTPDPTTEESSRYNTFVPFSTTEVGEFFNPRARVIHIDTRVHNDVNPILRPWGSLEDPYNEFGGVRIRSIGDDANYVSGGYVRRFYNSVTKTMTSYYFDHNEARWIRNIQQLPDNTPAMPNSIGVAANATIPYVIPWIPRGRQSGIV
ncbi:MAG: chitobiase/beta-hexosaminidase C-terminal domain-containing protein [Patescibacteria group bacterium]